MTREEAIICKIYLEDLDEYHTCNEYKLLMGLLEQEPCDDVISREEAIDACNQSVNILEATDRIKDLPPVCQEPKWIPVSERLPESDEYVLVTNGIGMYIGWIDATDKVWRVGYESGYSMNDILAWMPLPELYKAESEDSHEID